MRGHHPQLEAGPGLLGLIAHRLQRAARGLGGVGLDQGRVQPRQVAAQRVELRGEEDRDLPVEAAARLLLVEDLADADLVLGVAVAEQQADADPLDLGVQQLRGGLAGVLPRAAAATSSPNTSIRPRTPFIRSRGTSGGLWWWVARCSRSE